MLQGTVGREEYRMHTTAQQQQKSCLNYGLQLMQCTLCMQYVSQFSLTNRWASREKLSSAITYNSPQPTSPPGHSRHGGSFSKKTLGSLHIFLILEHLDFNHCSLVLPYPHLCSIYKESNQHPLESIWKLKLSHDSKIQFQLQ